MPCHLFVILVNVKMLGKNEYLKKIISQYHNILDIKIRIIFESIMGEYYLAKIMINTRIIVNFLKSMVTLIPKKKKKINGDIELIFAFLFYLFKKKNYNSIIVLFKEEVNK